MKNNKCETSRPLRERRNLQIENLQIPAVTKNIKIVNWHKIKKALEKKKISRTFESSQSKENKPVTTIK
jgi:hypothetical protein